MPSASAAMGLFLLQLHRNVLRQILLHSINIQLPHSVTLGSDVDRLHMCCESATYVHLGLRLKVLALLSNNSIWVAERQSLCVF